MKIKVLYGAIIVFVISTGVFAGLWIKAKKDVAFHKDRLNIVEKQNEQNEKDMVEVKTALNKMNALYATVAEQNRGTIVAPNSDLKVFNVQTGAFENHAWIAIYIRGQDQDIELFVVEDVTLKDSLQTLLGRTIYYAGLQNSQ